MNAKGINALIMALEIPEMMNKVMSEQQHDSAWPNEFSTNIWEQVLADGFPDNDVAEMEMDDDLGKLKLPRDNDPKELLADMVAIEVQYKYHMTERKKAAAVSQAGSNDHSVVMTMTSSMAKTTFKRSGTAAKLVAEMHKQYRIAGHKTGKKSKEETDDDNEIALAEVDEFNGSCNHCGKKGHKEIDCWSKYSEKRPSGNGRIKCNFCNRMGHKESDYWDRHPEKQPDWLKDRLNVIQAARPLKQLKYW